MRNREPTGVLGTNVHPVRPLTAVRAAIAASLLAALCVCLAAAPAGAAPALNWRVPLEVDAARALNGVSCASDTLCAAVDETGNALISTNPTLESWPSPQTIDAGHALKAVSCAPSSTLCVAVDGEGRAVVTGNAGASWSKPIEIDGTTPLTGVSCASTTLCVAVDESGQALVSATPGVPTTGSWSQHTIDAGHKLAGVSCAPGLPCVAVDDGGRVLVSNEPASGWAARTIDSAPLVAISCASAPANVCVAVDATGDALASSNPGAAPATWNATPVDAGPVAGVSCSAAGLCVLVDESGDAYVSDDPAAGAPSWRFESIDAPDQLAGVSCVAEGLCVAVDKLGHVLFTLLPPPVVGTGAPTIGETVATLAGTVDTNDAMLTSCRFEYGVSEAYGQSAPCPTALAAGSANQPVSAALSGLAANVTYDYRLVATSASGAGITANATFKTTAPPLVQPHPSISGIPALGQHLTCKSGRERQRREQRHAELRVAARYEGDLGRERLHLPGGERRRLTSPAVPRNRHQRGWQRERDERIRNRAGRRAGLDLRDPGRHPPRSRPHGERAGNVLGTGGGKLHDQAAPHGGGDPTRGARNRGGGEAYLAQNRDGWLCHHTRAGR